MTTVQRQRQREGLLGGAADVLRAPPPATHRADGGRYRRGGGEGGGIYNHPSSSAAVYGNGGTRAPPRGAGIVVGGRRAPPSSPGAAGDDGPPIPSGGGDGRYDYDDDDDDDDFERGVGNGNRSSPNRERPARSQGYLGAVVRLFVVFSVFLWFLGLTPPLPSAASSIMASPLDLAAAIIPGLSRTLKDSQDGEVVNEDDDQAVGPRPDFVYEHPYVSSSYYTSTKSIQTLLATEDNQVIRNLRREAEEAAGRDPSSPVQTKTRLAIVRPFCEFDAEALPTTFTCWNALPPCKAASADIGEADYEDDDLNYEVGPKGELVAYKNSTAGRNLYDDIGERHLFDLVGSDAMKNSKADVFLFYSQTFAENDVAIKAVDAIIEQFFEPGGWSQCFDNIYAIEANIPQELDLYIPSAQEELYNWVNGPNRQFEAAFRIIQSGEWGEYDGFYLMEGDSVPIKAHWLDVVLSEIEVNRPFAILGAQYDGDKWDNFYEKIPISLLHHTNGNAIYNTSHPLLERLVGQLEVEAPCPYNSIPYDYRMSQMWVEGTLGIVPELAPKIMLNEEGENITLSNNLVMFKKWAEVWEEEDPFKYTPVIHNYAATNLIPRHLGPEYIIHGAKLYSPWNPTKTEVTLVVSEWFFDRSLHLIKNLDEKDHPFSEVVVMVPPVAGSHDDYDELTEVPVRTQHRGAPDFMDLCEADIRTEWFMITNSYHSVARHVDLMFTPGTFKPVIPFTPATYPFCFKFPYCKETVALAQRFNNGQDKVIQDMDMLYNTEARNAFCKEWKEDNGEEGEDLYRNHQRRLMFRKRIIGPPGPTGTSYYAWLVRENKDGMYKMTDRSLYGARPPFVKVFAKEEKLDGMSEDELAKRVGMTLLDNSTDCNCGTFETEVECSNSGIGCIWRPLFESCHPPELIDGGEPICATTEAPTMTPTVTLPLDDTESPTSEPSIEVTVPEGQTWYSNMFKSREHEGETVETIDAEESSSAADDDNVMFEESAEAPDSARKLEVDAPDHWYETNRSAEERVDTPVRKLEADTPDHWYETNRTAEVRVDSFLEPSVGHISTTTQDVKQSLLEADTPDSWYETNQTSDEQMGSFLTPKLRGSLEKDMLDPWNETDQSTEQRMHVINETRRELEADAVMDAQDAWREADLKGEHADAPDGPRRKLETASLDAWYVDDGEDEEESRLPVRVCDPWDPSVVPRNPTASNAWAAGAASPDPESRSFSAAATSRPRRLHGSFLPHQSYASREMSPDPPERRSELSGIYDAPSPLKDSWLTSSVPINVPKYAMYKEGFRIDHRDLDTPEADRKTFVNYGDGDEYRPLRITFVTDHLLNYKKRRKSSIGGGERPEPITPATISRMEALTGDVLPAVSEIWAGALSVIPSVENMFPSRLGGPSDDERCGEARIPPEHSERGVPRTDTLVYVTVDGPRCRGDENARGVVSHSAVCSFDQNSRPISANVNVCLGDVDVAYGEVSEEEILRLTSALTVAVGRVLGLSPSLFPHFRSPETGRPYGSTVTTATCANGTELALPVPNVLRPGLDRGGDAPGGGGRWEVATPTVRQVIRNHFDCQGLLGARLGGGEDSSSCFGDSFDPRYHFDDDLAPVGGTADAAFSLSPLTLALLEDSGWYRANFERASAPLFGRGAGCGFLEGNCVGESKTAVPDYSRGFFCSDVAEERLGLALDRPFEPSGCDFTHNHKADCSSTGGEESDAACPMRIASIKSCSDGANSPSLSGEIYSPNSRCFVTDTPASVCLESYCNSVDSKIDLVVNEEVFQCDYEGQELDLGLGYTVQCPRLAVVCPHLACPASCSGRGVCDYCQEVPQCVCDDPFDDSPGCFGRSSPADAYESDFEDVSVESMRARLAKLAEMTEENEKERREEEEAISALQKRQSTMNKLSGRIDESEGEELALREDNEFVSNLHKRQSSQRENEDDERELRKDEAFASNPHEKKSPLLVEVNKLNESQSGGDEPAISHLHEKRSMMERLLQLEENERRLKEDGADERKKQSMVEKLSRLMVHNVENERELREKNAAILRQDRAFISKLHEKKLPPLADVNKLLNESDLGGDELAISHLHEKQSMMERLSQLEENERRLREDGADEHKKQSMVEKLSRLMVQSVENERELREENAAALRQDEAFISTLHEKKLPPLVDVNELLNESESGGDEPAISHLHEKRSMMERLSRLEENERRLEEDGADEQGKRSMVEKLSRLMVQSVEKERELREESAVTFGAREEREGRKRSMTERLSRLEENERRLEEEGADERKKQSMVEKLSRLMVQSVENERELREEGRRTNVSSPDSQIQEKSEDENAVISGTREAKEDRGTNVSSPVSQIREEGEKNREELQKEEEKMPEPSEEEMRYRAKIAMLQSNRK